MHCMAQAAGSATRLQVIEGETRQIFLDERWGNISKEGDRVSE